MKIEFRTEDRVFRDKDVYDCTVMYIDGVEVVQDVEDNLGDIARAVLEKLGVTDFTIKQSWDEVKAPPY